MTPTIEHVKLWFADPAKARQFFGNFEIQKNGCQLWMGPFFESGHGRYKFDGSDVRVHRLRWVRRRRMDLMTSASDTSCAVIEPAAILPT